MAQFVLIDHSLKSVGGHHYDYALHVLRAAQSRGYDLVLAAHRRFRAEGALPSPCRVFRVFPHDTYSRYAIYESSRSREIPKRAAAPPPSEQPGGPVSWRRRLQAASEAVGRRRRLRQFARGCHRLFRRVQLRKGDHVLLPTVSEFDLAGLVQYLKRDPISRLADWHLQFHYNIFDGRPPDYPRQAARRDMMRRCFHEALRDVSGHRLHFYTTTPEMAEQYNSLGAAAFRILAYPIHPSLQPRRPDSESARPLHIVCAGAIRCEKGQQRLEELARDLWPDLLANGKAQLLVQSNKSWFRVPLPNRDGGDSAGARRDASDGGPRRGSSRSPTASTAPIVYLPHPLDPADYVEFLRNADIGLLLYDSDRYYARRAGVLGELLAAGVPVVVPAGCWLAEQIAEPIYQHADRCCAQLPLVTELAGEKIGWVPSGERRAGPPIDSAPLVFGRGPNAVAADVRSPGEARVLIIRFRQAPPNTPGVYVRLGLEQYGGKDELLERAAIVAGRRADGRRIPALFQLRAKVHRIRIRWENAYHEQPVEVKDVSLAFLRGGESDEPIPSGAVGLIAADPRQAARLVREIVRRRQHYRRTAVDFSHGWRRAHDPERTVDQLLACGGGEAPRGSPSV